MTNHPNPTPWPPLIFLFFDRLCGEISSATIVWNEAIQHESMHFYCRSVLPRTLPNLQSPHSFRNETGQGLFDTFIEAGTDLQSSIPCRIYAFWREIYLDHIIASVCIPNLKIVSNNRIAARQTETASTHSLIQRDKETLTGRCLLA